MRTLSLILILCLFNWKAYSIENGGGDGDLGGGPSITTGALVINGFDEEVHRDLVRALEDRKFNKDLLEQLGTPNITQEEVFEKFQNVKFHANGSLTFNFSNDSKIDNRDSENNSSFVTSFRLKKMNSSPRSFIESNLFIGKSEKRNSKVLTINEMTPNNSSQKIKNHNLFKELSARYGEDTLLESFDTIIRVVGVQFNTGQEHYFKLESSRDFEKIEIERLIQISQDDLDQESFGFSLVNASSLKQMPEDLKLYITNNDLQKNTRVPLRPTLFQFNQYQLNDYLHDHYDNEGVILNKRPVFLNYPQIR